MSEKMKNSPKLRFPEFVNDGEWEEKKLIDVCEKITQGGTPDTSNQLFWNGTIEWLTPAEMNKTDSRYIHSTARKITKEGLKNCSSDLLPVNSVILSTRAPIGHLAINTSEMAINQGCKGLIPKKSTNYSFLYYLLIKFKNSLMDLGAGNTFKELSGNTLKNFEILIPSIQEQQKIADCLSSVDYLISAQSQKVELLKEHKKGLLQNLFPRDGENVPRLRFPEFVNDGEWEETKIGDIGSFYYGKSAPKWSLEENAPTKCVRYGELYTKFGVTITETYSRTNIDSKNLRFSKGGEILVPRVGEKPDDFGKCCCYLPLENIAIGEMISVFETSQNPLFYTYYFRHMYRKFANVVEGQNVKNLYYVELEPLPIHRPSPNEQQKIADCLNSVDEQTTFQIQKLQTLKEHKKALMQQLFPSAKQL